MEANDPHLSLKYVDKVMHAIGTVWHHKVFAWQSLPIDNDTDVYCTFIDAK